jgi:uncharacterized membrane protein
VAVTFREDFRRFFTRGLAAFLPTLLTVSILIYVFTRIYDYVGEYINIGLFWLIAKTGYFDAPRPAREEMSLWDRIDVMGFWQRIWQEDDQLWQRIWSNDWQSWESTYWWVGFVLAFVGIYIFGRFITSFIGRTVWRWLENGLLRMPVVKQVYPFVKQVTDFLFSERKIEFSRVVAVTYPRKGIWSVGMVTGSGMRTLSEQVGGELLTIFIPSSPTPFTGYTITVRREDVIDLPISIEEALRFTVSGGVIMPLNQKLSESDLQRIRKGSFMLSGETDKEKPE